MENNGERWKIMKEVVDTGFWKSGHGSQADRVPTKSYIAEMYDVRGFEF